MLKAYRSACSPPAGGTRPPRHPQPHRSASTIRRASTNQAKILSLKGATKGLTGTGEANRRWTGCNSSTGKGDRPKRRNLGACMHLLDIATGCGPDSESDSGYITKRAMQKLLAFHTAKASRTDKGPCEHLKVALAFSSHAADPMEAVRMIQQSSRITTFSKGTICCSASGASSRVENEEQHQVDASECHSSQKNLPGHDGNAEAEVYATPKQQVLSSNS